MKSIFFTIILYCCSIAWAQQPLKIGVLSDPHLHDIYPIDTTETLLPLYNSKANKYELVRSLESQMSSTRLFNENYFAFRQALSDLAAQNVKLVIISGDYTDDGQFLNVTATDRLLSEYSDRYDMRFFITNGNHEAVNPIDQEGGKADFITQQGQIIGVYSSAELLKNKKDIVYEPMRELGYESMYPLLKNYSLEPHPSDLFYTTPFHVFDYETYQYSTDTFILTHRKYEVKGTEYTDLTYLVEPFKDLWILSIDGNMYNKLAESKFKNISDGYHFIKARQYLLDWIKMIVSEAKKRNKKLLAFGHYPILEFNNAQTLALENLLGENQFQLNRVPTEETQISFLNTGLPIHFAGHMHINQHGFLKKGENILWNIQVPSLAAYPPAYKIVAIEKREYHIKTIELREVKGYNTLFDLYKKVANESDFSDFFKADNYYELTKSHLKYLSEHRFLNTDFADKKWDIYKNAINLREIMDSDLKSKLSSNSLKVINNLDFKTIVFDLYLIRNGNDIGIKEIDQNRLKLYQEWSQAISASESQSNLDKLVLLIYQMYLNSIPTQYLKIEGN